MHTQILKNTPEDLSIAVAALARGQVVAIPTETVYGLAGDASNEDALLSIFKAKERPFFDPLIVHVSDELLLDKTPTQRLVESKLVSRDQLNNMALRTVYENLIHIFWPGPLTIIFPKGTRISPLITSGQDTVAIRCPQHSVTQNILRKLKRPLCAPSANRFGRISPTAATHVFEELQGRIPYIVDGGPCSIGLESTIVRVVLEQNEDEAEVQILRPGVIGASDLLSRGFNVARNAAATTATEQMPAAPGLLASHYAPKCVLELIDGKTFHHDKTLRVALLGHSKEHLEKLKSTPSHHNLIGSALLSETGDPVESARHLYGCLRALDEKNPDVILCQLMPQSDAFSLAINDRLKRAAAPRNLAEH
jgi:L-threonylcarbamoyladenylate synthase